MFLLIWKIYIKYTIKCTIQASGYEDFQCSCHCKFGKLIEKIFLLQNNLP